VARSLSRHKLSLSNKYKINKQNLKPSKTNKYNHLWRRRNKQRQTGKEKLAEEKHEKRLSAASRKARNSTKPGFQFFIEGDNRQLKISKRSL